MKSDTSSCIFVAGCGEELVGTPVLEGAFSWSFVGNMITSRFCKTSQEKAVMILWQLLLIVFLGGSLQQGIRAEEYKDLPTVLNEIREFRATHGYPPTLADYRSYLGMIDIKSFNAHTAPTILHEVLKQQSPHFSLSDISKIIRAKQESLRDYIVQYDVDIESRKDETRQVYGTTVPPSMVSKFATKKNRFFLDRQHVGEERRDRWTYNGEVIIHIPTMSDAANQGGILPVTNLEIFNHPWMPLTMSGLSDTNAFGNPNYSVDLALFLEGKLLILPEGGEIRASPYVFEKIKTIDGHSCVVISCGNTTKYLDVDRDFSLIQSEFFRAVISDSPQGQILTAEFLASRTRFYDLKDFGNGIWLPSKIEAEYFNESGETIRIDRVTVRSIEINQGIDALFSLILFLMIL